ncbi:MAG TPA: hypothetical protein VIK51_05645 [Vicinamibacteria bacterium]
MRPVALATLTLSLLAAGGLFAQEHTEDLEKKISALQAELNQLRTQGGDAQIQEVERRLDLLAAEIEALRTGGATADVEAPARGEPGLGPAASKVYRRPRGVSIGGYGETLYRNFASKKQDGSPSGLEDRLDLLRLILYTGYKFSDQILFNSEIEFEHATTGEGDEEKGEVSVEQAYVDLKPWKRIGIRAGMVVVPLGFINELHEPPIFLGSRRPEVEQRIIPTTWHEVGLGLFGETGQFQWRGYAVAGLNASGFEGSGIKEGRQQGSESLAEDIALTGRLDFVGAPGLLVGGSVLTGKSGQGAALGGRAIDGRVTLFDVHAQYERRGLQARALYVGTRIGDAALINAHNGVAGHESVGNRQYGFYVEAGYDLMTARPHGQWAVIPFVRFEQLDTQNEVPSGFERNPALDQKVWTAGVSVKPLTGVVFKADGQWFSNKARTGATQFNAAVGYLF